MPDDPKEPAVQPVFRLMYRSVDLIPAADRKAELGRLFTQARYGNKAQRITGALMVHGDWFVQVLEGDERPVRALFAHIERDPRHESVALLETGTVPERVFAHWAMARVSEDGGPDIPLIAHTDGISRAAGRPTTPEQEAVLDRMRAALQTAARTA
jgi:Sensors of blue-light using FAD